MKLRKVLITLLVSALLMTGTAWAISGSGTSSSPYLVDKVGGSFSLAKSAGDYYVTVEELFSTNSAVYCSSSTNDSLTNSSYAKVIVTGDGTEYTVDHVVVRKKEYVTLLKVLPKTNVINEGTLTVSASDADSGHFNKVQGNFEEGSNVTVTSGNLAYVQGKFKSLNGSVVLSDETSVYSGTPSIVGNGQKLNVCGGTVSVSGEFSEIIVESGATLNVTDDTELTNSITIQGIVNISSGKTLLINGNAVAPETDTSFDSSHPWGQLNGTYDDVVGNWELSGDVTINGTQCGIKPSYTGATVNTNGHKLSLTGGNVSASGSTGTLSVSGGQLEITGDTLAEGVSISNSGTIKIDAGKTLRDDSLSICPTDGNAIVLSDWGTLGTGTYDAGVLGAWTVPSNATVTVTSTDASGALLTGTGGMLTASADNVSVKGAYSTIAVSANVTLGVADDTVITNELTLGNGAQLEITGGKTICDQYKSIRPKADTTLNVWGGAGAGTLTGSKAYGNLTGNWDAEANVTIEGTGYSCGVHTHGDAVTITGGDGDITVTDGTVDLTGKVTGTVYVSGGTVTDTYGSNHLVGTGGIMIGTATSATDGTTLDAGDESRPVRGSFASITGTNILLVGDTVIYSTGSETQSATINGNGHDLDVRDGDVRVKGTFGSVKTEGNLHVSMAGDAELNGGQCKLTGDPSYRLTVGGGSADIEGSFKQIIVNGGTVTDCDSDVSPTDYHNVNIENSDTCLIVNGGETVLDNGGRISSVGSSAVSAVQVHGGKLTIGKGASRVEKNIYQIFASSSGSSEGNIGINVLGGKCMLLDGAINVSGTSSKGVQVFGTGAQFQFGGEQNTDAYDSLNTPSIVVKSEDSAGVYVHAGGEAWLHAGELYATDKDGKGVYVTTGNGHPGICHVWGNDRYGTNTVGEKALLYLHGGNSAMAAMWVADGGSYDIRGRGVLFEEPSDYNGSQYALYINENAIGATEFPLSGGTFDGKVRYVGKDISNLLLYNHYLRYDGAAAKYGETDGTYGVRPGTMTKVTDGYGTVSVMHSGDFSSNLSVYSYDGAYRDYFGVHGEFYTITDAEWELRQQMNRLNGCYQIPAGIVRSDLDHSNAIALDINVFDANETLIPCWGAGKKLGDIDVSATGHTIYLAGRTIQYNGCNWKNEKLDAINTEGSGGYGYRDASDWRQVIDVNSSATLEVRDSVFGVGYGVNPKADKASGGYIGTGTISYEWADDSNTTKDIPTRALYATGRLDVVSAQIKAIASAYSSGLSASTNATINIGMTNENNDNRLIHILGGLKTGSNSCQAVYLDGGTVTISGGILGAVSSQSYGGNVGVQNAGGTLHIKGGIVAGNTGSGKAVWSSAASGKTYISGGCLYGVYLDDDANGGTNNGDSICVTNGKLFLSINAAHSGNSYQTCGYTEDVIPLTGTGAYQTDDIHHIYNITVDGGALCVGALQDYDESYVQGQAREIQSYSRDNGYLLCTGGHTVFYGGIVMGDTNIVGDDSIGSANANFGTEFYALDGNFGSLSVLDGVKTTSGKYYAIYGDSKLTGCVQLHGGSYNSIDVSGLTTGWSGVYAIHGSEINHIIGFWTNAYDVDDDGGYDWIRYNHYATMDKASRNTTGYWTGRQENIADAGRLIGSSSIVASTSGKTIYIHDGAGELISWLTSNSGTYDGINGSTYKMCCNVWLSAASNSAHICHPYFHCAWRTPSNLPVLLGVGHHIIDTNHFGLFGDHADALIKMESASSSLKITNSNTATSTGKYEDLIRNYAEQENAVGIEVINGTLTISGDNANAVTVKAYDDAVLVSGMGSVVFSAGELIGKGSDALSDGIKMKENAIVTVSGGTITGEQDGICIEGSASAIISGSKTKVEGGRYGLDQTGAGSKVTVSEKPVISGKTNGFYKANVTAQTSLAGGLYSSIVTNANGETLSNMITSTEVKDAALVSTRAAQTDSKTVSDYVLKHETALRAADYDDDGDAGTGKVTYREYFVLAAVTPPPPPPTPSGGGASGGVSAGNDAKVIVNGKTRNAGTLKRISDDEGRSIDLVTFDENKLQTILDGIDNGATIDVPITNGADIARGAMTGEMVKKMAEHALLLELSTKASSYTLHAADIDINGLAKTLGANDLEDITITIQIEALTESEIKTVKTLLGQNGLTMEVPPVSFTVGYQYKDKTGEISDFGTYVKRTIKLPKDVNAEKATTGVVVKSDGVIYPVPSYLTVIDGESYMVISSRTNSTYAVVGHTVKFADSEGHWAERAILDMGSRMIVSGVPRSGFEPNRSITRAEFAAIIVRALGLAPGNGITDFSDVASSKWYAGDVETAYAYGIITGYDAQRFGPDDCITREQAMTMIARAMKITGLSAGTLSDLSAFQDAADISTYALDSVAACVSAGLVNGRDNDAIAPKAGITRAEIASIVQRLLQKSALI